MYTHAFCNSVKKKVTEIVTRYLLSNDNELPL